MVRHFGVAVVFVVVFTTAVLAPPRAAAQVQNQQTLIAQCSNLLKLKLQDTTIKSTEAIPAGPFPFGNTAPTCASPIASPELPGFCRVQAVVAPAINFEVWLPLENWNGKFQALGNHGFAGNIEYSDMGPELVKGYAVAGTDTGHSGNDTLPWMQNEQQIVDYGFRGIHELTVKSKTIVQAFYGQAARYSYFNGCSTGGKEGLMEAQRYPADYDGIVTGHPNFAQIHNRAQYVWNAQVTFANPESALPPAKLQLINKAVLATCDKLDGIVDGVVGDPLNCPFEPQSLLCKPGQDAATCLTAPQVTAVEKIYTGPRNPRTGQGVYPGFVKGSELGWAGNTAGPRIQPTADQFFKFMVFKNPSWDYKTFDFDRDLAYTDETFSHLLDAINPDLRAFRDRGGKLIHYHSFASTTHTAPRSIEYYEDVVSFLNKAKDGAAFEKTQGFYRLFMAPGGNGSKGPDNFDPIPYLERWVEKGMPPDRIIASDITKGAVDRTRPLCPYPRIAVYKGSGTTDEAKNFVCKP
jgi:feruloyl esterase